MQNLIQFLIKYGYLGLFLVLQAICFNLIVNYNQSQGEIWINSVHLASSRINNESQDVRNYFRLSEINDSLALVNAELLEQIVNYKVYSKDNSYQKYQTKDSVPYRLIQAPIASKTLGLRNNFFTIAKGWDQGIQEDQGVLCFDGIVGTVIKTSKHYSKVLLINNSESKISAKVKDKGYFGNLKWTGSDYTTFTLEAIPKYAEVVIGDTILTSGYSTLFPKELFIGVVDGIEVEEGSSNFSLSVKTKQDVTLLDYVYVIDQDNVEELRTINASGLNDE